MAELMDLDPQLVELGAEMAKVMNGRWFFMMTPEEAREVSSTNHKAHANDVLDPELLAVQVEDRSFDFEGQQIKLKVYKPPNLERAPVIMYYHGGGWVFGNIEDWDQTSRMICALTECVVVSVEYLLAPENKFPAPVKSAFAAVEWALEHIDELGGYADSIVLAGDSAGGNITAATALYAARNGVQLGGQAIIYGVMCHLDYCGEAGIIEWPDRDQRFTVKTESVEWYWGHYLEKREDGRDPIASPMLAKDLDQVAPALISAGMLDTFNDDCVAYGKRLREAGVPVKVIEWPHISHGFINHGWLPPDKRSELSRTAALTTVYLMRELAWRKHTDKPGWVR
jgi:acetyl esterase